jgi:hypothetical protein
MRAALRCRLERLEVAVVPKKSQLIRSGYLKTLPADFVGERHVVIVKREPAGASGNFEWCEFEERPGPAPVDAPRQFGDPPRRITPLNRRSQRHASRLHRGCRVALW